MTTINWTMIRDNGHYYGRPGYEIEVNDGLMKSTPNADLLELARLADAANKGVAVAGGDVIMTQYQEITDDLLLLSRRVKVVHQSTGNLSVHVGLPYVQWELSLSSSKLANFLSKALNYDGPTDPLSLLTEFRSRHSFETPLELNSSGGWVYTTWSGTQIRRSDDVDQYGDRAEVDPTITIAIPLDRVIHRDGKQGFHFSLLA